MKPSLDKSLEDSKIQTGRVPPYLTAIFVGAGLVSVLAMVVWQLWKLGVFAGDWMKSLWT